MKRPCLLDLKLASKPYNEKKIARQQSKIENSTCSTHGFRMCGYSTYGPDGQKCFVDKYVGRTMKANELTTMFKNYF
jgi:hypothetical protein